VLAVGDAAFQQKCQSRMESVIGQGCTLLFVSHNLQAIVKLCGRALYLDAGMLRREGPSYDVVGEYLDEMTDVREEAGERTWMDPASAPGSDNIRLRAVRIVSEDQVTGRVNVQSPVQIEVEYWNFLPDARIQTSIHLSEHTGVGVLSSVNLPSLTLGDDPWYGRPQPVGVYRTVCTLPANILNVKGYVISVFIVANDGPSDVASQNAIAFHGYDDDPQREYHGVTMGVIRPKLAWKTAMLDCAPVRPS
jgi:lipopolysaccharide transport system ATP-binding protein